MGTPYLMIKQHVEPETKSSDEQHEDDEELTKSFQYVCKHDNINSNLWELSQHKYQVDPRYPYGDRSYVTVNIDTPGKNALVV